MVYPHGSERTPRLDFEHLVRVLHDLAQSDRLLQLLLPLAPRLRRLREHGVQPAEAAIVVDRARVNEPRVRRGLGGGRSAGWSARVATVSIGPSETEDAVATLHGTVTEIGQS